MRTPISPWPIFYGRAVPCQSTVGCAEVRRSLPVMSGTVLPPKMKLIHSVGIRKSVITTTFLIFKCSFIAVSILSRVSLS